MDKYYVYRPMLDLLGRSEGTDKGRGYNETLAYGAFTGGPVELVKMTLDQVNALQMRMLSHKSNKHNSSAAGRYQIVRRTLISIREKLNLGGGALFDAEMQDRLACYLLGLRGIDKWLAGRLSTDTLLTNLAQEWASLPTPSGAGYYGNQRASVSVSDVKAALAEVRRRHLEGQPETAVIEKPVVPAKVEKEVRQKTNWLTTIFGAGGVLGGFGSWAAGVDTEKLLIISGLGVGAAVLALVFGEWIVRRVRRIRKAVAE